jgi:predicted nucleic acid-binding protein
MTTVFLDTVGVLALWDTSDQWHSPATEAFASLVADRAELATTTYVLAECANAAARRPYRLAVCRLRDQLEAARSLVTPSESDWQVAWEAYRRSECGLAGLVDHLSFVVMRRLGITKAFTNDHHFRAAGFEVLF